MVTFKEFRKLERLELQYNEITEFPEVCEKNKILFII